MNDRFRTTIGCGANIIIIGTCHNMYVLSNITNDGFNVAQDYKLTKMAVYLVGFDWFMGQPFKKCQWSTNLLVY